eukprot:g37994.t1
MELLELLVLNEELDWCCREGLLRQCFDNWLEFDTLDNDELDDVRSELPLHFECNLAEDENELDWARASVEDKEAFLTVGLWA